jgi:HrpA-like RNA helicase
MIEQAGFAVILADCSRTTMISLPIDAALPALRQALANRDEAVLEAPPGAGKTTRVPWRCCTSRGWPGRPS